MNSEYGATDNDMYSIMDPYGPSCVTMNSRLMI